MPHYCSVKGLFSVRLWIVTPIRRFEKRYPMIQIAMGCKYHALSGPGSSRVLLLSQHEANFDYGKLLAGIRGIPLG